ncbi:MAG: ubiquitin-like protein Pup [Beutenbergiaceae bacterium]
MPSQQFSNRRNREPADDELPPPPVAAKANQRDAEVDSLLADIDDVLETNAETFVRGFVQKGGQ